MIQSLESTFENLFQERILGSSTLASIMKAVTLF